MDNWLTEISTKTQEITNMESPGYYIADGTVIQRSTQISIQQLNFLITMINELQTKLQNLDKKIDKLSLGDSKALKPYTPKTFLYYGTPPWIKKND